eukprot:2536681-Pyramimonas_sp.AAC.1
MPPLRLGGRRRRLPLSCARAVSSRPKAFLGVRGDVRPFPSHRRNRHRSSRGMPGACLQARLV